jgi:hypothetical protein
MLEGANMIAEGAEHVLVCYADDVLPQPYRPYMAEVRARYPFSISLLLTRAATAPLHCHLVRHAGTTTEAPETALMRFLVEERDDSVIGVDQLWRLERSAHVH